MKPSACGLGLTLLHEHDVCPSCRWPAGDPPSFTGRRDRPIVEPDPAPPIVEPAYGAALAAGNPTRAEWRALQYPPAAQDTRQRTASPEPAPLAVPIDKLVQEQPGARAAHALRILGRACLEAADALVDPAQLDDESDGSIP